MSDPKQQNIIIIGAGFYGCSLALYLKEKGFNNITILEREDEIMKRASYKNQARVHNGYHYPRSFITALRSRINFPKFNQDYSFAIKKDFTNLYAISKKNSKITSHQFERFAQDIGANFETAGNKYSKFFNPDVVDSVYLMEEFCFDAGKLKNHFTTKFAAEKIKVICNSDVRKIFDDNDKIKVAITSQNQEIINEADLVLNCAYSNLNNITAKEEAVATTLKHEFTELCLISPPEEFKQIGITIMDGAFFSMMPFPAENCHSLSHVSYTPFSYFFDNNGKKDPLKELEKFEKNSCFNYMIADVSRYCP
jgi:glycine/D-amino acid oxidase-like deaminating enzyme